VENFRIDSNTVAQHPEITVITPRGYIDTTTSLELKSFLEKLHLEKCCRIIIDLSQVDYISSAGWGELMAEAENCQAEDNGNLILANLAGDPKDNYELIELSKKIQSAENVSAAIEMFINGIPPVAEDVFIKRFKQINISKVALHPDITVVKIPGYLDKSSVNEVEIAFPRLIQDKYKIILDLSQVRYFSEGVWQLLKTCLEKYESNKSFCILVKISDDAKEVQELVKHSSVISSADTIDEAIGVFSNEK
jgi:anti-anti-sigma factor